MITTEENILQQAGAVFYRKGLAGARMQEIADLAGINKAMLHYYFKTKEQLFGRVFLQAFEHFVENITIVLNGNASLEDKIVSYVNQTVDALAQNPGIPVFVLNELSHNPQRITALFAGEEKINLRIFREQVDTYSGGKVDYENLFIDMVALCVYPFVVAPVFKQLLHKSDEQYTALLQSRKDHVVREILGRLSA